MKSTTAGAIIFLAVAICAQADDKKKADDTPAPQPTVQKLTIPKDAVPDPDGLHYAWTDKEGKKWTYSKTPFGIVKSPARSSTGDSAHAETKPAPTTIKAIDKGDTVRFERPSPFGVMAYEKKKTELTVDERRIFDAQNAKPEQK
jgi:hypothetical protein